MSMGMSQPALCVNRKTYMPLHVLLYIVYEKPMKTLTNWRPVLGIGQS